MSYGGAGHPPLLIWHKASGKATQVLENGLVLGMFADADYSAVSLPLEPGDRTVLYTDGIVEAPNASEEQFGEERIMRSMENNKALGADQFANVFLDEVSRWGAQAGDQGQQDDITLLVIDFKRE